MKIQPLFLPIAGLTLLLAVLPLSKSFGQIDGDWISTTSGTQLWSNPANWSSNPNVPGGVGAQVTIESSPVGHTSIDLQATNRTVGILNMGDSGGTRNFTISSSDGGTLIFERAGGAQMNVNQGGENNVSANVVLNSNLALAHQNPGFNVPFTGIISGTGGITQTGTGRVYFASANTFEGGYTLNSGTAAILLGGGFGTGTLTFNGGNLENAGGNKTLSNPVNLGGHLTRTGTSNLITLSGQVTLTADSRLTTNERLDITGDITGSSSLTKDGPGLLNLFIDDKSFSGGFTLDGGEVLAQGNQSFGTGTLRLNGGTLSAGGGNRTYANTLEMAGSITLGNTTWGNRELNFSGSTTLLDDTTLHIATPNHSQFSGNISGDANLITTGPHNLILRGENSYTGYTEVQSGTLRLFRNGNIFGPTAEVRVTGGALEIVAWNQTIGTLVVSSGAVTDNDGNRSLSASSFNFTDSGTVETRLAGTGALTKSGDGVVSLNRGNGNTYSGGTMVTAGTLLVNNSTGSGTGSGAVSVAPGAVLGGDGIISGPTTISGSLQPGNSIGTLTINNDVTWNGGDAWVFELGTAANSLAQAAAGESTQDQLIIGGVESDFLRGSGTVWSFDFADGGAVGWYQLITWSGATTFNPGDFTATNLADDFSGTFVFDDLSSGLYLQVIPEPSAFALLASAFVFALLRRRITRR